MLVSSTTVTGRCLLCGERHTACGQRTAITPVDEPIEEAPVMAEVALYTVDIGGQPRQMKLTPEDADRLGATPVKSTAPVSDKARKPANKARRATSKDTDED